MTFGIRRVDSINGTQSSCGFFGVYPGSGCSIDDGLTLAVSPGERRRPGNGRILLGVNHPRPLAAK